MAVFHAGNLIKECREQKKLTQMQLCEGICSVSALSRIESGEINPSYYLLSHLVERLGCEVSKFGANITSAAEMSFVNKYEMIKDLLISREFLQAEMRLEELEQEFFSPSQKKKKKVNSIKAEQIEEESAVISEKIKRQLLLCAKSAIAFETNQDEDEILRMIEEAINLTIPNFGEENIRTYLLSFNEISLIEQLAFIHRRKGNMQKAIGIFYSLIESLDKYYFDEYEKSKAYCLTLYNLSSHLGQIENHNEVLKVCDLGIQYCRKHSRLRILPNIAFNKACALYFLDEKSEYKELIIQAYYSSLLHGDVEKANKMKQFSEAELNFVF